ncbi:MAG: dephospho-CoA kinase [Bacteroidales bacterium]|nr:dephospho-CoA kinase [Bacteroidales bacterium]
MLKIGLTGNIGSGKTLVAQIFSLLDCSVYNADENAKKFYYNPAIKEIIVRNFGNKLLSGNAINLKLLADIVFNSKEELKKLNSIIHPLLIDDFKKWAKAQELIVKDTKENNFIIMDAAIIFENNFNSLFDKIITVSCPKDLRIKRLVLRDKISVHQINIRINNQLDEAYKIKNSDYVIINDDKHLLIPQVLEICEKLNQLC